MRGTWLKVCRAFYDDFAALDDVRKVLGLGTDLSLVDEQWVGILRRMIDVLTRLRKVIDFHQARIAFEKVLKHYRIYRQELEDEVKTLLILEGLKSAEATCSLLDRLCQHVWGLPSLGLVPSPGNLSICSCRWMKHKKLQILQKRF